MVLANRLLLPQERFNIKYRPVDTQRVACPRCGGATLRKHLVLCSSCGKMGCPCCIDKKQRCSSCRKDKK